jgi:hypothetical protein
MVSIRLPRSDFAKIVLAKRALEQLLPLMAQTPGTNSDQPNASAREVAHVGMLEENINPLFIDRFQKALASFQSLIDEEAASSANHRNNLLSLGKLLGSLSHAVRDAWSGIRRLARRKSLDKTILIAYQMPLNRSPQVKDNARGWLEMAQELLEGDASAIAQGFPAMTNPDAAEVREILDQARERVTVTDESSLANKEVQARLRDQRVVIHNMIRVLAASLRTALVGSSPSYRRDVMRKFGFTFTNDSTGTVVDETLPEQEQTESTESAAS